MKQSLSDELRVRHVLDAIMEINSYLQKTSLEEFLSNSEKRFATIKQLEIIGEACNRISPSVKEKYPEIEWNNIIGFPVFLLIPAARVFFFCWRGNLCW